MLFARKRNMDVNAQPAGREAARAAMMVGAGAGTVHDQRTESGAWQKDMQRLMRAEGHAGRDMQRVTPAD